MTADHAVAGEAVDVSTSRTGGIQPYGYDPARLARSFDDVLGDRSGLGE